MAAKRELHLDPDYEALPPELQEKRVKLYEDSVRKQMQEKIVNVLKENFEQEINSKDAEIDALDENLYTCRAVVDRLRACIITKFYASLGQDQKPDQDFVPSLHPTIKKHMDKSIFPEGKCEHVMRPGSSKEADTVFINGNVRDTVRLTCNDLSQDNNSVCNSNHVSMTDDSYNVSRFKTKCKIVVGNISKFIPVWQRNESDQSTHKWMVYVRGDKDKKPDDVDVNVKKVRFLLHPSYRPNDIVEINSPPFQLVKRGWGEFPVRVQLHFHDTRNKPVDIIHNLKLDKTFTGLQTLGAETIVDLQLYKTGNSFPPPATPRTSFNFPISDASNSTLSSTSCSESDSLHTLPVKMEIDIDSESNANDSTVNKKLFTSTESNNVLQEGIETNLMSNNIFSSEADSKNNTLLANNLPVNKTPVKKESVPNGISTAFVKCTDSGGRVLLVPQSSLVCIKTDKLSPNKTNNLLNNNLKPELNVKNSKVIVPSYILKVVPNKDSSQKQVIMIPMSDKKVNSKEINKPMPIPNEKSLTNNSSEARSLSPIQENIGERRKHFKCWEQEVANINLDYYKSFEELLRRVTKIFPLVKEDVDRTLYPFCATSLDEYLRWNIGKQRASEWRRAGVVRTAILKLAAKNSISYLTPERFWSRRDIMLWCRKNGFVPMSTEKMSMLPEPKWSGVELCSIANVDELTSKLIEETTNEKAVQYDDDEEIEVIECVEGKPTKSDDNQSQLSAFHMPPLNEAALYVKDTALQLGVNLKPVELEPSLCVPVVEEMILASCRELASDLISHAVNEGFDRLGGKLCPEEITVSDIYSAIKNNSKFSFLSNCYLGKPKEYEEDT
ncbi:uncharacterized protein [Parasteatoda tepidariorum]|uniref:uncharacterized protein n=1 Tax=Parasteatoda tepidariorum TaxID=114398 RepID=UPI000A2BFE6D|nr:YEATS domain-containing protein 2 [Parasteatoda tepidariorum]XP_021002666.1 YEATS domain-containing protein 2 [Parasteatoda tepidariorum]